MPTLTDILKAKLDLCEKATAGPWAWRSYGEKSNNAILCTAVDNDDKPISGRFEEEQYNEATGEYEIVATADEFIAYKENNANYADFNFIASARTDVPALVKALMEALPWVEDAAGRNCTCADYGPECLSCNARHSFSQISELLSPTLMDQTGAST